MRPGDLTLWTTPHGRVVLAVVLFETLGYGGVSTGWWNVLADSGAGVRTHLTRRYRLAVLETT